MYLFFLNKYCDALRNPRKYLLSAVLMIIAAIVVFYSLNAISILSISLIWRNVQYLITNISYDLLLLTIMMVVIGFMYCGGIGIWSLCITGQHLRKMSLTFKFRVEPVHPDNCGGLSELGNFCFASVSPLLIGSAFFIGWFLVAALLHYLAVATIVVILFIAFLIALPVAIFAFFRPLLSIHTNMLCERKTKEEHYAANIASLREKIQVLLDANQLDEAKTMKEKKELMETLYIPSPTWPFHVKSKLFQTTIGAGGSLLVGVVTGLGLPLVKVLLHLPS